MWRFVCYIDLRVYFIKKRNSNNSNSKSVADFVDSSHVFGDWLEARFSVRTNVRFKQNSVETFFVLCCRRSNPVCILSNSVWILSNFIEYKLGFVYFFKSSLKFIKSSFNFVHILSNSVWILSNFIEFKPDFRDDVFQLGAEILCEAHEKRRQWRSAANLPEGRTHRRPLHQPDHARNRSRLHVCRRGQGFRWVLD